MASKAAPPPKQDPMDLFPFRGQYGGSAAGSLLFVSVRSLIPVVYYAFLAPPQSPYSIYFRFPSLYPSRPPPNFSVSTAIMPSSVVGSISTFLGLSPPATVIFLYGTLPSISFIAYNLLWRRERLPLTGQGGAIGITAQVNFIDLLQLMLFVYGASRNPTWSAVVFQYTTIAFLVGFTLHTVADHTKYLFRKEKRNDGRVMRSGVWGIVRHPNFLGFTIWRLALGTAAGGWGFALAEGAMFSQLFGKTSVPILERYMERYGREWDITKEKVKWKMVPGVW